ncbi:MAG: carbohydrate kinase, partial [Eubacterium sp.]|nr:carbohydrate kinase [Eubacterium sp.]
MSYLMGIDIGGTVVKAAVYDLAGKEISVGSEKLQVLCPDHGMTERSMDEVREKTLLAVRNAISSAGITDGKEILAVGMTGQGNGAYFVDKDGNPIWNGIMSSDARAKDYVKKWDADGTFDRLFPQNRKLLWSGQVSLIVSWFKDHHPEILAKAAHVGSVKDYIRFVLTDNFVCELTEASSWNVVDMATGQYADNMFEIL